MLPTRSKLRENHRSDSSTLPSGLNEFITATSVSVLIDTGETRYRLMSLGNYEFGENRRSERLTLLEGFK
jgi:hypothetical protein